MPNNKINASHFLLPTKMQVRRKNVRLLNRQAIGEAIMINPYKMSLIFTLFLALCNINSANAFDVQKYKELKKTSNKELQTYILGNGEAYSWVNVILEERGDKAFYCPPSKIRLNEKNYIDIIDRKITSSKKDLTNVPIEYVLFMGLVEFFPCPN